MRKRIALALALLLLTLPILSLAQEATPTEEGDLAVETATPDGAADESGEAEDMAAASPVDEPIRELADESSEATGEPADAGQVADKALELTALIARAINLGATPFDGAPDAETAWALTYAALEQGAVKGLEDGTVTLEDLNAAYGQIFSEGELPGMPSDFSLLALESGVYHQTSDPGDVGYAPYLVGAAEAEALVTAEVAVMAVDSQSPEDLTALIAVTLTPDDASPFGATLSGFSPIIGAPAMTKAEATATLKKYKNITYIADNVLDGKYSTCWAYPVEDKGAVITLSSEEPQTVRGIRLTPAYAKSEKVAQTNNRVKAIHVALSDGSAYDFSVQPDLSGAQFDRFASFAFDGTHEVTWVSVQVTEVYPGDKYEDTCISEIALF